MPETRQKPVIIRPTSETPEQFADGFLRAYARATVGAKDILCESLVVLKRKADAAEKLREAASFALKLIDQPAALDECAAPIVVLARQMLRAALAEWEKETARANQ